MNVITLEEEAFYQLLNKVVAEVREQLSAKPRNKWVDGTEAMRLLGIKSKSSLQKLRDEGKIRFSHPQPKVIMYDTDSIDAYLDKHAKDTF